MTPRQYRARERATSKEETRRKILEASLALHSAKGVKATSWTDIAEKAGVSVGTVYYHFPTVDDLIPACSGLGMELNPPPTIAIFAGLRSKSQKIERLVRELATFNELHRDPFLHTLHERSEIPALSLLTSQIFSAMDALVREALGPDTDQRTIAIANALVDIRVFEAFRDRKVGKEAMISALTMSLQQLSDTAKSKRNVHPKNR